MTAPRMLRLMIVDDSAQNRRVLHDILDRAPRVEVVASCADGEEALRMALSLRPDAIFLDLQMPRMDGFTFLRILMNRAPTPVVVVSGYSAKENVFKALELGALDFVAKPPAGRPLDEAADAILEKVRLIRTLERPTAVRADRVVPSPLPSPAPSPPAAVRPKRLVAIAASTGGPAAIGDLLDRIPSGFPGAILIVQHMPEKFTRTFAERLDRRTSLQVREAADGDIAIAGTAWVAPGQRCMEVQSTPGGLRLVVRPPTPTDRYVPSADRLFHSAALAAGPDLLAVVLTGMGDDGREALDAVKQRGGSIIAEAPETAVIFGMPGAAIRTGHVDQVLPGDRIPAAILDFVAKGKG